MLIFFWLNSGGSPPVTPNGMPFILLRRRRRY